MMLLNAAAGMLSFRLMRVESLDASEKFASGKKTVAGDLNPNPFCTQILLPNHLKPNFVFPQSHQKQPSNMARGKKKVDEEQEDLGMKTLMCWDVSAMDWLL